MKDGKVTKNPLRSSLYMKMDEQNKLYKINFYRFEMRDYDERDDECPRFIVISSYYSI